MKDASEVIKISLFEGRKLEEKEILLIIKSILEKYGILNKINDIEFDYNDKYSEIAGFERFDNLLYYNMNVMNISITRHYLESKSIFNFDEFYVLEQLITILHELRHAIQFNCDYHNKELIKKIIMDSDINKYSKEIYDVNYSLFPIEKDASVFAIDKMIDLLKKCDYFKESVIKRMYDSYFKTLIAGYDVKVLEEGRLKDFYLKVVGDHSKYLEYLKDSDSINLHDKLAYNFPIPKEDIKRVILIPSMINADFDPRKILKK